MTALFRISTLLTLVLFPAVGSAEDQQIATVRQKLEQQYGATTQRIMRETLKGNEAWQKMHELCDGIGFRLSGSPGLEEAIDWAIASMKKDGQENCRREKVMIPKWTRGKEWARMESPRKFDIHMLGLGMSVGTPPEGITAPVVVVHDEESFAKASDQMKGKFVLFNNPMPEYTEERGACYGHTVRFRYGGPALAAEKGAVGCLVRSVTARSLRSPHTGSTGYQDDIPKIPAAAISTEDADMIQRLTDQGQEVTITLKMDAKNHGMVPSANVIAEYVGREKPEEIVIISGHIDAWDVGHGAHDDGGGCVMAMEAINVLRKLKLRPRRTIRVVLWTNEENGQEGAKQYALDHANELANHVAAIESDSGVFQPQGFSVQHIDPAKGKIAEENLAHFFALMNRPGLTKIKSGWSGADISHIKHGELPLMGLIVEGSTYFDYHHTHADTLDKVDPKDLTDCVATLAAISYLLAEIPGRLDEPLFPDPSLN